MCKDIDNSGQMSHHPPARCLPVGSATCSQWRSSGHSNLPPKDHAPNGMQKSARESTQSHHSGTSQRTKGSDCSWSISTPALPSYNSSDDSSSSLFYHIQKDTTGSTEGGTAAQASPTPAPIPWTL